MTFEFRLRVVGTNLASIVIAHARIRFTFAFGIALTSVVIVAAQESNPTSDPKNTPNAIQALDQLIEQNQRLEKQNQQIANQNEQLKKTEPALMEQIKVLRGAVAQRPNGNEQAVESASAQATAGAKVEQTGQSSSGDQSNGDDKTQLPKGSEGNLPFSESSIRVADLPWPKVSTGS